jgi:hypothetical protein
MAVIVGAMNHKASLFQEQMDTANTAMKNMRLSESLQLKVRNYLLYTQKHFGQ